MKINDIKELTGLTDEEIMDLVSCGDLPALGSKKELFRLCDLNSLLGINTETSQNTNLPIDFSGKRRSNQTHSILIEDITESEWDNMKKTGKKEHTPYFDNQKQRWCIALSLGKNEDGKRIRKIISGVTQAELWDTYREYLAEQKEVAPVAVDAPIAKEGLTEKLGIPTYKRNQDILFSERYMEFLAGLESTMVNRTFGGYVHTSKYIVEQLGHLKMYELNKKVVQKFLNDLINLKYASHGSDIPDTYYSQSRITLTYDLLHRFIQECSDDDSGNAILEKNFMSGMKKPRTKALKGEEVVPYTADEVNSILDAIKSNKKIYCWIMIMATTGVRPGEALALKYSDIDYQNKTIDITRTLGKEADYDLETHKRISPYRAIIKDLKNENGRNSKVNFQCRTLKVSQAVLDSIKEFETETNGNAVLVANKERLKTSSFLFTGPKGDLRIYEDYRRDYIRLLGKADLPTAGMNPYRFRHTVCTDLLRRKVDLKTVQMIMGDNTPDMILRVYANLEKKDLLLATEDLANRMDDILYEGQTVANVTGVGMVNSY